MLERALMMSKQERKNKSKSKQASKQAEQGITGRAVGAWGVMMILLTCGYIRMTGGIVEFIGHVKDGMNLSQYIRIHGNMIY